MSHSVTVRTTTTTSTSAVFLNVGYMTKVPGILKLLETIVGSICLSLISYYTLQKYGIVLNSSTLFLFLTAFACLLATFLLLVSAVCHLTSSTLIPKTLFELLYHIFAFIFYFCGGLAVLIPLTENSNYFVKRSSAYKGLMAASVLGLLNSGLYIASAIFSYRSYRGAI